MKTILKIVKSENTIQEERYVNHHEQKAERYIQAEHMKYWKILVRTVEWKINLDIFIGHERINLGVSGRFNLGIWKI